MRSRHAATHPLDATHAFRGAALLVALLLLAPTAVRGQSTSDKDDGASSANTSRKEASDAELKRFETHVASGTKHFRSEAYQKALTDFREARSIIDVPELSFRIGRCLEKLHRCEAARTAYERFMNDDVGTEDRERAQSRIWALEQCEPRGHLELTCRPKGATVRVGDDERTCPLDLELKAGTHMLTVRADGYITRQRQITLEAGQQMTTSIELDAASGTSSLPAPAVSRSEAPPPTESSRWPAIARWSGLGAGAAFLAGGLISDVRASSRIDSLERARTRGDTSRMETLLQGRTRARRRTIGLYATGALLAVGGSVFFFVPTERPPSQTAEATDAGLELDGRLRPTSVEVTLEW